MRLNKTIALALFATGAVATAGTVSVASSGKAPTAPTGTCCAGAGAASAATADLRPGYTGRPCACIGSAAASTGALGASVSVGYESTFFCRGMDMGDDLLSVSADVDVKLAKDLTWTISPRYLNVDETGFEETQLYTGLFYQMGNISVGPSFRWYHNIANGMMENAYDVGLQALVKLGSVNVGAGYYYETESEGSFFELSASTTIKVSDRVSIVPAAEIGYTDGWMMPMLSGWNHVGLRVTVPIKLTDSLTLSPYIGGNLPLSALDGMQDDRFVGGVSLSLSF